MTQEHQQVQVVQMREVWTREQLMFLMTKIKAVPIATGIFNFHSEPLLSDRWNGKIEG